MGRTITPSTAPDPLATVEDYEVHVGPVGAENVARIEALLVSASASIRAYVRRTITRAETVERCKLRRYRITLKERPIHEITSVVAAGGDAELAYTSTDEGILEFTPYALLNSDGTYPAQIDVTYSHGLDDSYDPSGVLPAVVGMACTVAARAFGVKPESSGVTSETISGYTYQLGAAAAAGGVGLLPNEEAALRRLFMRSRAGTLDIAR